MGICQHWSENSVGRAKNVENKNDGVISGLWCRVVCSKKKGEAVIHPKSGEAKKVQEKEQLQQMKKVDLAQMHSGIILSNVAQI